MALGCRPTAPHCATAFHASQLRAGRSTWSRVPFTLSVLSVFVGCCGSSAMVLLVLGPAQLPHGAVHLHGIEAAECAWLDAELVEPATRRWSREFGSGPIRYAPHSRSTDSKHCSTLRWLLYLALTNSPTPADNKSFTDCSRTTKLPPSRCNVVGIGVPRISYGAPAPGRERSCVSLLAGLSLAPSTVRPTMQSTAPRSTRNPPMSTSNTSSGSTPRATTRTFT